MSRTDFKNSILAHHWNAPQRKMEVDMALNGLFEALDTLARHGHPLTVTKEDRTAFSGDEWPKMLYHPNVAPEGRIFHQHEVPTESGWNDKPFSREEIDEVNSGDPDNAEKDHPTRQSQYPKKMFHKDVPGGISVMNADMERDYLERGYTVEPQLRTDGVDYGSTAREIEGQRGNIGMSDQGSRPPVTAAPKPKNSTKQPKVVNEEETD